MNVRTGVSNDSQMEERIVKLPSLTKDFPGGSDGKVSGYKAGDPGSITGSGRSPGEGNGNPLQCSCLENPMDGGAWQATAHGVAKSWTDYATSQPKII